MSAVFQAPSIVADYPWIGGGADYDPAQYTVDTNHPKGPRVTKADADVVAQSVSDIPDNPSAGTTIWLDGNTTFDVGGASWTFDANNVTVASDRGIDGSDGALVRTNQRVKGTFTLDGEGCRLTSFRLEGPEPDTFDVEGYPASEGVSVNGAYVEIDNMQIRGWTHAAIEVGKESYPNWLHVHHCELVDNHAKDLGYGLTVFHGTPRIRACLVDNNRHSIAGDGAPDCAWTLMDSIVGPHHRLHALDMHSPGGKCVTMEHNIVMATHNWYDTSGPSDYTQEALSLRAVPASESRIEKNQFYHEGTPPLPLRDSNDGAINVMGADDWAEAKITGIDTNCFGPNALTDGMGPREVGYAGSAKSTNSADSTTSTSETTTASGSTSSDGSTTDTASANPTAGRAGPYDVTIRGSGDVSVYALVARDGIAEADDSFESNDELRGRAMLGQVSTLSDTVSVTGPIETFDVVGGDPNVVVEIDGQEYAPGAFDAEPSSSDGLAPATATKSVTVFGALDVAVEVTHDADGVSVSLAGVSLAE